MRITRADDKSLLPDLNLLELLERISSEGYIPTYEEKRALETRKELNLNGKEIITLPDSIKKLKALEFLRLDRTKLVALPESIGQLSMLKSLSLSRTDISALPESIGQLSALMFLNISQTKIESLPTSIGQLTNLETLDLSDTKISFLPEQLGKLPRLRHLELCGLTLPELPISLANKGIPFIDKPHLGWNDLGINLYNTTFTKQKISVFLDSPELIPGLYTDQITLRECKVIFLGDGGSGKTYTIQRFQNNGKKETKENSYITKETPGIEISNSFVTHGGKRIQIRFWDFGGQQLLHAMHRCFLTDETCYVVTVSTRATEPDARAKYWLRNVKSFAPKSPVLLYINCWDNDNGKNKIDENGLRSEFHQIKDVVYCSAKEDKSSIFRKEFMNRLNNMVIQSGIYAKTVNKHWDDVRQDIIRETKKKDINFLTKEHYHEICAKNLIKDENAPSLLTFFNNLGICFSYHRDADQQELLDYKLLEPVWLTNALYAIIEEGLSQAQNGIITVKSIEQMLRNEPPKRVRDKEYRRTKPELVYKSSEECQYILDVACSFNLCYRINSEMVFFPALCPTNSPKKKWAAPEDYPLHVEYCLRYDYLPDNVIHQLMIRCMQKDLAINNRWLRGMVLGAMNTHKAMIRMEDDRSLRIDIWSRHDHPPYQLFSMLRDDIDLINNRLHLNKPEECVIHGEDHFTICALQSAAKDNGFVYGDKTGDRFMATQLLGKFYDEWTIQFIVDHNEIIVPIIPREYHRLGKNNVALRAALFQAYRRTCPYCRSPIDNIDEMEVDHILPSHYIAQEELKGYIEYLNSRGFDTSKPDYIENYLPVHRSCNNKKGNYVELSSLLTRHNIAARNTPRVLKLIKEYKDAKP